jgi:Fic family protein
MKIRLRVQKFDLKNVHILYIRTNIQERYVPLTSFSKYTGVSRNTSTKYIADCRHLRQEDIQKREGSGEIIKSNVAAVLPCMPVDVQNTVGIK